MTETETEKRIMTDKILLQGAYDALDKAQQLQMQNKWYRGGPFIADEDEVCPIIALRTAIAGRRNNVMHLSEFSKNIMRLAREFYLEAIGLDHRHAIPIWNDHPDREFSEVIDGYEGGKRLVKEQMACDPV